ncbi:MAG: PEP-CTERM sorting domain-containing protein [Steroidobacteraceae bacterium]
MAAIAGAMVSGVAFASPIEMFLTSGTQSTSLLIGNTGTPSSVSFTGSLNGWTIESGTGGTSYAPNEVGLDLQGYLVTCADAGCSTSPLTVLISAIGFSVPITLNQFQLGLSGTASGGTVTTAAYYDTANGYFCNADADDHDHDGDQDRDDGYQHHDRDDTGNDCGSSNLIGSLSLSGTSNGISVNGGPDPIRSYSLTIVDTFSAGGGLDPSYSVNTTLTSVPEPGTLALFGAGLLGCVLFSRRRRARPS